MDKLGKPKDTQKNKPLGSNGQNQILCLVLLNRYQWQPDCNYTTQILNGRPVPFEGQKEPLRIMEPLWQDWGDTVCHRSE